MLREVDAKTIPIIVSILALLLNPILAFLVVLFSKKRPQVRNMVFVLSGGLTLITLVALALRLSTTILIVNWLLLSNIYFSLCLLVWLSIFYKKWFTVLPGAILGILTIPIGYILSTIGILGLCFIVGDLSPDEEAILQKGYVCRLYSLGNAISDYRGGRVVLSKRTPFLPFEHEVFEKTYKHNVSLCFGAKKAVKLELPQNRLIVSVEADTIDKRYPAWCDTLNIH